MMAITHCSIAAAGTSLILGTAAPLPLGLAILGSQLPDLDTTTSTIGLHSNGCKIFFPVSSWIEDRFPHRSITHSLLATAVITIVSLSVGHFLLGDIKAAIALPLGHRLKTGGAGELWVLAMAITLLTLGYYLANGGGVTTKVSQSLGLKDGIVRIYNQNTAANQVYADIN